MQFNPIKSILRFLCSIVLILTIVLACSKDTDETYSAFDAAIEESEEIPVKLTAKTTKTSVTSFSPTQDAYIQSDKSYNQQIMRLDDGRRTSFLKFDLRDIASNGGTILTADFEFTISSDGGDGTVFIYQGEVNGWTEEKISGGTAPATENLLAKTTDDFEIGQTKKIRLDDDTLNLGFVTLIMVHKDGNDLAFASKEHPDGNGPKLVISYSASADDTVKTVASAVTKESVAANNASKPIAAVISATVPPGDKIPLTIDFKAWNSKNQKDIIGYNWNFKDGSSTTKKNPTHTFTKAGRYSVELQVKNASGFTDTTTLDIVVGGAGAGNTGASGDDSSNETTTSGDATNVTAVISASIPSHTRAPVTVAFKAYNSKNQKDIKGYFWDFNDGSTTTTKNPDHTYSKSGTYSVRLTVKNAAGQTSSTTRQIVITGSSSNNDANDSGENSSGNNGSSSNSQNINVAAVISGSIPASAKAPATVEFKAYNSKNQNDIKGYFWDFNDGSTTTKKNPSHTFNKVGNYTVKLSVKNAAGQISSTTRAIKITSSSNSNSGSSSGGNSGSTNSSGGDTGGSSGGSVNPSNYPSNAVFASDFGFKSGDATSAFEAALKSGSSYVVIDKQSSDWVIRPSRFFDLRNMTIVFESGVTLRAKSGAFAKGDELLHLTRAKNVTIEGSGATFKMNKSEYNSGEQRHALSLDRCNDITVRGLTLRDSGGDGIIISGDSRGAYSENITLDKVRCVNNRRNGLTIVSAQNVYVRNSEFSQSNGTKPEAGVTLEPDNTSERLVNINFSNCKFSGNDSSGIHLSTIRMKRSSRPISIKVTDSEFNSNSKSPESGVTKTSVYLSQGPHNSPVGGEIRFERVRFTGNTHQIIFSRKAHDSFRAIFKDCVAKNVSTKGSRGVIELQASSSETSLGGFVFDNFQMEYRRDVPFMEINAPRSNFVVKDISGDFDITEPNDNPIKYSGGYESSNNQNVSIDYDH